MRRQISKELQSMVIENQYRTECLYIVSRYGGKLELIDGTVYLMQNNNIIEIITPYRITKFWFETLVHVEMFYAIEISFKTQKKYLPKWGKEEIKMNKKLRRCPKSFFTGSEIGGKYGWGNKWGAYGNCCTFCNFWDFGQCSKCLEGNT